MRVSMIGSGGMLHKCLEIAATTPGVAIQQVFIKEKTPNTAKFSTSFLSERGIRCITYDKVSDLSSYSSSIGGKQDLLVSVYNEDRLASDFLSQFTYAINFHDSPLPKY